MIVMGADISINHGAMVTLHNGEIHGLRYYTDKAGGASKSMYGERIPPEIMKDKLKARKAVRRLTWLDYYFLEMMELMRPAYCGLEDYAFRATQGAHQIGEVGGQFRRACWSKKVPYRLHDPMSVKLFAAHHGHADKKKIAEVVADRWGLDFSAYDSGKNTDTSEDLADAFVIAQMVWTEIQLRSGELQLSDLHEKEIQVFNRVTKAHPVNLLGREWIR